MQLLLVRHGDAVEHGARIDGERWLTPKGRRVTRAVADALREAGVTPARMLTSPLVRAVQTCEILAAAQALEGPIEVLPALVPNGEPALVILALDGIEDGEHVALVGHEPNLSALASELLGADVPPFEKSAVCALRRGPDGAYVFEWMLRPRTLERVTSLQAL
jgi:phosphohistidine phosphatase